jgi:hypothetical protein
MQYPTVVQEPGIKGGPQCRLLESRYSHQPLFSTSPYSFFEQYKPLNDEDYTRSQPGCCGSSPSHSPIWLQRFVFLVVKCCHSNNKLINIGILPPIIPPIVPPILPPPIVPIGLGPIGLAGGIIGEIHGTIAESIADGISSALGRDWGPRDWDDFYERLVSNGAKTEELPPVEAVMAYTETLRANMATAADAEKPVDE